jgi:dynein heavy chain
LISALTSPPPPPQDSAPAIEARFEPLQQTYGILSKYDVTVSEQEQQLLTTLPTAFASFKTMLAEANMMLEVSKDRFKKELLQATEEFHKSVRLTEKEDLTNIEKMRD